MISHDIEKRSSYDPKIAIDKIMLGHFGLSTTSNAITCAHVYTPTHGKMHACIWLC